MVTYHVGSSVLPRFVFHQNIALGLFTIMFQFVFMIVYKNEIMFALLKLY